MKIIIAGCGKMGRYLTEILSIENHDITVIDKNNEILDRLNSNYDVSIVNGNALVVDTLMEANVEKNDILISVMKNDEDNILCCLIAKKLGIKNTIARTRNPEYKKSMEVLKKDLGLSMSINPELLTAKEISSSIKLPENIKSIYLARGKAELIEFQIQENSILKGLTVKDLNETIKENILVIALERNNKVIVPEADFILNEKDKLIIASTPKSILKFFKTTNSSQIKVKNVMVVGGSNLSYYLCDYLNSLNIKTTLIESDKNKCLLLSEKLDNTLVVNGDGSDRNLLLDSGIKDMDAFVATTGIDEENVVFSMFANKIGIKKVITKINHLNFSEVLDNVGINSIFTPHVIASNYVLRYIRSKENSKGGSMESLIRLLNDKLEIMEFKINSDFSKVGKQLKNIKFKKNLIIICVNKKGSIIFPTGDDTIDINDRIFISTTDKGIKCLNDILE